MRRQLLCLLLAALLLTATGCANWEEPSDPLGELSEFYGAENETPEPEPLTTFTLPYFAGESLDPVTTTETVQSSVGALLYEKLFELDEHYVLRPLLADSCTYDAEQRVYTLTLRSGVTFSDGSALTARDVAATLERRGRRAIRRFDRQGLAQRQPFQLGQAGSSDNRVDTHRQLPQSISCAARNADSASSQRGCWR